MENTPKSMRLQIAMFGRTNVGKSSFLNMLSGQDVAMTSTVPGTTTDVVEKSIELLPIGPVTLLDTPGINDTSVLSEKRIQRTMRILGRADIIILICEVNQWTEFEDEIVSLIKNANIPFFVAVNKIDTEPIQDDFIQLLNSKHLDFVLCSSVEDDNDKYINPIKNNILKICPAEFKNTMSILGDLIPQPGLVVLIVPIDTQAPKGRIILPQVQAIRDILDNNSIALVVQVNEYKQALELLNKKPDIVICDSQVVMNMVADTPEDITCTTFSILFSRFKGDIVEEARGAAVLSQLTPNDKVLIAEACSHHPLKEDIGRIKIPNWLRQYLGFDVQIDVASGRDFPENLSEYKVIIHCGSCMLTRNEKLVRINKAVQSEVAITNYGIAISFLQGVIERVLSPFPDALAAYIEKKNK